MLPSTLDMVPSPSTWNPRPSTLDKKIDSMYIYACLMRDVHRSLVGDESIYSSAAALFENSITAKRIMRLVLEVNITTFFSYNSTY